MNTKEILDLVGEFTWDFGQEFYIETKKGNFVYSSPEYGGTNEIWPTGKNYAAWIDPYFGRSKGKHVIRDFVSKDVVVDLTLRV